MTKQDHTIHYQDVEGQLRFGDSVFPRAVVNANGFTTVAQCAPWVAENLRELESQLEVSGALLFRGFPVDSAEAFDNFSAAFGYDSFTYQESLSNAVRINYTERVFSANEAPPEVEIYLHHEMAQTPISPARLFFFCKSAAATGGATPLCRSDQLCAALTGENPELAGQFRDKGVMYATHMPLEDDPESGQGRSWKSTLSVANAGEAEAKLRQLGYSWEWLDDGSLRAVSPKLPAILKLENGVEVFYNQLIAAYMGWPGARENPSRVITFGDGSEIPAEGLERIVALSKQFIYDLNWQDGDVALVDNKMAMHGRRPFSGNRKRQVLVALAA